MFGIFNECGLNGFVRVVLEHRVDYVHAPLQRSHVNGQKLLFVLGEQIGLVRHQQIDQIHLGRFVPLSNASIVQGRVALQIDRVHIGAVVKQELNDASVPGQMECCGASEVLYVRVDRLVINVLHIQQLFQQVVFVLDGTDMDQTLSVQQTTSNGAKGRHAVDVRVDD